jgi:transcriptional regulator with XRE-family HTH domain
MGISPSYVNQLESNQRPVTAAVLLKLADALDVDLAEFSADAAGRRSGSGPVPPDVPVSGREPVGSAEQERRLPQRLQPEQDHQEPAETEAESAVRRAPVSEAVEVVRHGLR